MRAALLTLLLYPWVTNAEIDIPQILADPSRTRLYVLEDHDLGETQSELRIIDSFTRKTIKTIGIGKEPSDLCLSEDGSHLYTLNARNPTIREINLETFEVTATHRLTEFSSQTSPDQRARLAIGKEGVFYYTDEGPNTQLRVFHSASGQVLQSFGRTEPFPGDSSAYDRFGDIALAPSGEYLIGWKSFSSDAVKRNHYQIRYQIQEDGTLADAQEGRIETSHASDPFAPQLGIHFVKDDPEVILLDRRLSTNGPENALNLFPEEIFSTSPLGEFAVGRSAIYDRQGGREIFRFPAPIGPAQVVTQDYSHLVHFDFHEQQLVWMNLSESVSREALGLSLSPTHRALTTNDILELRWEPVPGVFHYDVYLGTNRDAVSSATIDSPEHYSNSYPRIRLTEPLGGRYYYWRVVPRGYPSSDRYEFAVSRLSMTPKAVQVEVVSGELNHTGKIEVKVSGEQNWTFRTFTPWLTLVRGSDDRTETLNYSINTQGLEEGEHHGSITISSSLNSFEIPLTLTVIKQTVSVAEADLERAFIYLLVPPSSTSPFSLSHLVRLDATNGRFQDSVQIQGKVDDLAIHYQDDLIYVASHEAGMLHVFDKNTLEEKKSLKLGERTPQSNQGIFPVRVAAGPLGQVMLESKTNGGMSKLTLLQTSDGSIISQRDVHSGNGEFSADRRFYFHGEHFTDEHALTKYDTSSSDLREVAKVEHPDFPQNLTPTVIATGDGSRFAFGNRIYDSELNELTRLNTTSQIQTSSYAGELVSTSDGIFLSDSGEKQDAELETTQVQAISTLANRLYRFHDDGIESLDLTRFSELRSPSLNPDIPDGSYTTEEGLQLSWSHEPSALSYEIYFGTDSGAVSSDNNSNDSYLGSSEMNRWEGELSPLSLGEIYYWRVDTQTPSGLKKGPTWSFHVTHLRINRSGIQLEAPLGANLQPQTLKLEAQETEGWTAFPSANWIQLDRSTGSGSDDLIVTFDHTQMSSGENDGRIIFLTEGTILAFPIKLTLHRLNIVKITNTPDAGALLALSQTVAGPSYLLDVEASTGEIRRYLPCGNGATDFSLAREQGYIYFANPTQTSSVVIDWNEWAQVRTINPGDRADRVHTSPQGDVILERAYSTRYLIQYDPIADRQITTGGLGGFPGLRSSRDKIGLSPDGFVLYLIDRTPGSLQYYLYTVSVERAASYVNLRSREFESISTNSPDLPISPDGERIFLDTQVLDKNLQQIAIMPENIVASDSLGQIAVGQNALYWADTGEGILSRTVRKKEVALSSDDRFMVTFDSSNKKFVSTPLDELLLRRNLYPKDGQIVQGTLRSLSTPPVAGAISYELFWGTSEDNLTSAGSQESPDFKELTFLPVHREIFWRIDATLPDELSPGIVRSFIRLAQAEMTGLGLRDGDRITDIQARDRQVLTTTGVYSYAPFWLFPATEPLPSNSKVTFQDAKGGDAGKIIANTGSRIYSNRENGGLEGKPNSLGVWEASPPISPRTEEGSIPSVAAAGDYLFLSTRERILNGTAHTVEIFSTMPSLQWVSTLPGTKSSGFGANLAAFGNTLVVENNTSSRETREFYVYRLTEDNGEWKWRETDHEGWSDHGPIIEMDTDGDRIAILSDRATYFQTDEPHLRVYRDTGGGDFELEWEVSHEEIEGLNGGTEPNSVAIDGDLLAIGSHNTDTRLNHPGTVFLFKREGDEWLQLPNVTDPIPKSVSLERLGFQVDLADGVLFTSAKHRLFRFEISPQSTPRPLIEVSEDHLRAVTGRAHHIELSLKDATTVTAHQLPSWLELEEEDGLYFLRGTAPSDIHGDDTIWLEAQNEEGLSDFFSAILDPVSPYDIPAVSLEQTQSALTDGEELYLAAQTSGQEPFSFQWYFNNEAIEGEVYSSFSIPNITPANKGRYHVSVTNSLAETISEVIEVTVTPASHDAGDWPTFGANNKRNGHYAADLGTHFFIPKWSQQVTTNRSLNRSIIVADTIYAVTHALASGFQGVKAFDLSTGEELWNLPFPGQDHLGPPSYHAGRLYVQTHDRSNNGDGTRLHAIDAETGTKLQFATYYTQYADVEAPAITDEGIWIGSRGVRGFSPDLTELYHSVVDSYDGWTPAVSHGRVFSWLAGSFTEHDPFSSNRLYLSRPDTIDRFYNTGSSPALTAKEAVVISATEVLCYDLNVSDLRWRVTPAASGFSYNAPSGTPAIFEGEIYVIVHNEIITLDLQTGEKGVTFDVGDPITSQQPLLTNDHLICATGEATYIFDLETQVLLQTIPETGLLSYARGVLTIAGLSGKLSVYQINDLPDIVNTSLPGIIEETPFTFTLTSDHLEDDETLTYEKVGGLDGIEVSPEGIVSGVILKEPNAEEEIIVLVSDGVTPPVEKAIPIQFTGLNDLPEIQALTINLTEDDPPFKVSLAPFVSDEETTFEDLEIIPAPESPQQLFDMVVMEGDLLNLKLAPNQFGQTSITLTVIDKGGREISAPILVNVQPVNDSPVIHTPLENITANAAADPQTIDLSQFASDADPDDVLMYSITTNSNPSIFSELSVGTTSGLLSIQYAPYLSGSSEVTLRVTDLTGEFVEQSIVVTLPALPPLQMAADNAITLNRQTGLYEQKVTITNSAARAVGGFELAVSGLVNGYRLYHSLNNQFLYHVPLAAGEKVTLILEYHSPTSRDVPTPSLEVALSLSENPPQLNGEIINVDRIVRMEDQSILLEFETVPGKRYAVQYTEDMNTWISSPAILTASANRSFWLDQGLPKTDCHPRDCQNRYYRVIALTTPAN